MQHVGISEVQGCTGIITVLVCLTVFTNHDQYESRDSYTWGWGGVEWKGIPTGIECIQLEKVDLPKMLQ